MSNKFKIRSLENEKRRIDKLITKLKEEDLKKNKPEEKHIGRITEERSSTISSEGYERTVNQEFYYTFTRNGNKVTCELRDSFSKVIAKGVAICCEDDDFNETIGCVIAERRAMVDYYKQVEKIETSRH